MQDRRKSERWRDGEVVKERKDGNVEKIDEEIERIEVMGKE